MHLEKKQLPQSALIEAVQKGYVCAGEWKINSYKRLSFKVVQQNVLIVSCWFSSFCTKCLVQLPKCVNSRVLKQQHTGRREGTVMAQGLFRVQMSSESFPICALLHFEGKTSSRLSPFDHYPMWSRGKCQQPEVFHIKPFYPYDAKAWEREMTASIKKYISGHYPAEPRKFWKLLIWIKIIASYWPLAGKSSHLVILWSFSCDL